jgi:iron complex transport system ATP-binding protein
VALAALLAQEAGILLVDEPANHLDPGYQAETYRLLGELWRQGLGVVCVTHDVNLLAHAGGAGTLRVFGMRQGAARFEHCFADDALAAELGELFGVPVTRVHAGTRPLFVPLIDVPEQAP